MDAMEEWKEARFKWHLKNGLREENLKWEPHAK